VRREKSRNTSNKRVKARTSTSSLTIPSSHDVGDRISRRSYSRQRSEERDRNGNRSARKFMRSNGRKIGNSSKKPHTFETFLLLDEHILGKRDNLHRPTLSTLFDDEIVGERERLTISRSPPNLKLSATTSSENLRKV